MRLKNGSPWLAPQCLPGPVRVAGGWDSLHWEFVYAAIAAAPRSSAMVSARLKETSPSQAMVEAA